MRRTIGLLIALGVLVALGGFAIYRHEARPETSPVAQGARLVHAAGCFACHGYSEDDHRTNARKNATGAWRARSIPTLWENGIDSADTLIEWIAEGCPPDERERHQQLHVQMPAYGQGFLSAEQIDGIAAWILAQGLQFARGDGGATADAAAGAGSLDEPALVREGDRLSRQYGCYQCHGELGQGGGGNLASFKGYIPGFFGEDFRKLTDGGDRDEIAHWIKHGRGRAIENGPAGFLARRYFQAQAIGMPAYEDRMTEAEVNVLVDYLLWLNRQGPLPARRVEALARQLAGDAER